MENITSSFGVLINSLADELMSAIRSQDDALCVEIV